MPTPVCGLCMHKRLKNELFTKRSQSRLQSHPLCGDAAPGRLGCRAFSPYVSRRTWAKPAVKAEWELAKSLTSESKHVPEQRNVSLPGGSYTWHKNWPNCS